MVNGVLFLELKRAFNSVDHDLLMNKLKYAGLAESTASWFGSYLTGRSHISEVNYCHSSPALIDVGVQYRDRYFAASRWIISVTIEYIYMQMTLP